MNEDIDEMAKRLKWYESKYGPYIEKRGLHNWRNLLRWPTMQEWIIFVLIIMCIYFAIEGQSIQIWCNNYILNNSIDYSGQMPNVLNNPLNLSKVIVLNATI